VTLFFVLSGYLISRNLLIEQHQFGRIRLRRFWWHRALRLMPCYVSALAATAVLAATGAIGEITRRHFVLSVVYLSNLVDREHYTHSLAATWSLAVEEHFYLLWPVVLLVVPRRRLGRALVAALVLCLAVRVGLAGHPALAAGYFWPRWTVPAADALIIGCGLAVVVSRRSPTLPASDRTAARLPITAAVIVGYLAPVWLPADGPSGWNVLGYYLQVVAMAAGLWLITQNQGGSAVRVLELSPLRRIGQISYGVYVWQGVVLGTGPADQAAVWQRSPLSVLLIVAIAAVSWLLVERPIVRWGRRLRRRSEPARHAVIRVTDPDDVARALPR
jgi:peptidoglycan/LPS O-acetylase OafA/YrhL